MPLPALIYLILTVYLSLHVIYLTLTVCLSLQVILFSMY